MAIWKYVAYFVIGKTCSKKTYDPILYSNFNFHLLPSIILCNNMIGHNTTYWTYCKNNKENKSRVISKTTQIPYLEKQSSNSSLVLIQKWPAGYFFVQNSKILLLFIETLNHATFSLELLSSLFFHLKLLSSLYFHFFKTIKFTAFSFKTVNFVTFSFETVKFPIFSFKTVKFLTFLFEIVKVLIFTQNCLVCHFLSETVNLGTFSLFQRWWARFFFIQKVNFATFIQKLSSLLPFYSKMWSLLLFHLKLSNSPPYFNLKVVKISHFLIKTI